MLGVLDDFTGFGFLAALQVRITEEVHSMRLVVGFGEMHFRGMSARGVCGNIRSDGILPESEANKDMRRHVYGVGGVRCDGGVAAGGFETLSRKFGTIRGMDHVVGNARMV